MEKLLLAAIILVIFTINANAAPPPMIIIYSEEELFEMREMVNASDKELEGFLFRSGYFWGGMTRREHVITFLELLDSLPIPYIEGTRFNQIVYYPSDDDTYIVFSTNIGETHTLRYNFVSRNNLGELLFKHNGINVYSSLNSDNSKLNEHGAISFIMEIDRMLIRTGYNRGDNRDITTFNAQERYRDLIVTSFVESPWVIKPEPFTTADALEILRAVAGLASLTDAEAARLGISGEPTTADAIRILRIVAGLA